MESKDEVLASNKAQTQKIESEADRIIGIVGQASKPADGGGDGGVEQPSQDAGRYYEWCLSDAGLHEEMPEWMAEVSPTRNTNSVDAHLALVHGVDPQPADARAKHSEAVDSGTSGGGANPAAKKARVAAVVISSGGPHFAATPKKTVSSGVEEQWGCATRSPPTAIKQPRAQPMKSSGVAQSVASRQIRSQAARACNTEDSIDFQSERDQTKHYCYNSSGRTTILLGIGVSYGRRALSLTGPSDRPTMTNSLLLAMSQFSKAGLARTKQRNVPWRPSSRD